MKKPANGGKAKGETEKDADDLVHSKQEEAAAEIGDDDPDDIVHRLQPTHGSEKRDGLEDPDDLAHRYPTEDD
jgi:hypothetical protein